MLSKLASVLITQYDKVHLEQTSEKKIHVSPVVAEVATWYEKFRTAMDYREDEVILRSSIERIIKRRLILGGSGETVAAPLIRELVWARYFPDGSLPETVIERVAHRIDLYLKLQHLIQNQHTIQRGELSEWLLQLLSADLRHLLQPGKEEDVMSNFIFQIFKSRLVIEDDNDETRDVQVFIAVRRSFAKDDLALLRYELFKQYFGHITTHNLEQVAAHFTKAYQTINQQLNYPLRDKINTYIKNQIVPFIILGDVLRRHKGNLKSLVADEDRFNLEVLEACSQKYKDVVDKVRRAIVRSVIFIFFTKAIIALSIEGTYESFFYGRVMWRSIAINTLIPPILMVIAGVFITTPTKENSFRILKKIQTILLDEQPKLDESLILRLTPSRADPFFNTLFVILWILAFGGSFAGIIFVLSKLQFNIISQMVFIFFLAIISFVSYRINQTAHTYIIKTRKESLSSVLFDFIFMPFIHFGRRLTLGISQLNVILFIFDFIIETPFKSMFAFFEQWFLYLRTQREKLD